MNESMKGKLREYGKTLKEQGWDAAETVRKKYRDEHADFDKWCEAIAVFLRAEEIREQEL